RSSPRMNGIEQVTQRILVSLVTDFLHIVCAMRSQSTGSEPSNAVENRLGTLGPHEGLGLLVMHVDELQDGGLQFPHAVVRTSFDLALGQQSEPALHLIQPGAVRGSE